MLGLHWNLDLIPGMLVLGVFFLILGIFVAIFAEKSFWWWWDLLHKSGTTIARWTKGSAGLWAPGLPPPHTVRTEMRFLRVAGIILAVAAGIFIFSNFIRS
jgi:hypothetical protein